MEIFEHSVYPTHYKLTLEGIQQLFKSFKSADQSITLSQFQDQVTKHIPTITKQDAEIYFLNYKVISENDVTFLKNSQTKNFGQTLYADVKLLSIYFFLQLFHLSVRKNLSDSQLKDNQFNESFKQNLSHSGHNALNSPRSKTVKVQQFTSEQQQVMYYIKNYIKKMLELITNNSQSDILTNQELNLLQFFLQTKEKSLTTEFLKLYNLINIQNVCQWINNNLQIQENNQQILNITCTKSVMTKENKQCQDIKEIKIVSCEDSFIYIDACIEKVLITNCVNTNIFISSVGKICSVEKCEKLDLYICSQMIRIGNTIDSQIYYYGVYPPVLYGDNRGVTLAPNNIKISQYKHKLIEFLSFLKVQLAQLEVKYWRYQYNESQIFLLCYITAINTFEQFLEIADRQNIIQSEVVQDIKQRFNIIIPLLAPNEYRQSVLNQYKTFTNYQNKVAQMGLSEKDEKLMHQCIQSHFREWLTNSGTMQQIADLVKLIDQE